MDTDGPAPGENLGTELSDAIVGFHEATGRLLGVSAADHKALGVIQREGPLSASELAARTSVTPGAITGLIDRLEAAGLAHRERDPADRRRLVVTASAPTDPRVTAAFAELGRAMAEVVAADRKSTRLNSSHVSISYAVFCLKKKRKRKLLAY